MKLFNTNETAFITGAGSGIGRAVALQFIEDGLNNISLIDLTWSPESKDASLAEITALDSSAKIKFIAADVSKPEDVAQAIQETVDTFGRIDYCVNAAGIAGVSGAIEGVDVQGLDKVMDVNFRGLWLCERAQIRQFLKQGERDVNTGLPYKTRGSIVNIASILGQIAMPGVGPYLISKHAVVGTTKANALDYAKKGIRVNAICPGYVHTHLISEEAWKALDPVIAQTPMQRLADAKEIAYTITFLVSDRSSFTTGSFFNVDGGYVIQ